MIHFLRWVFPETSVGRRPIQDKHFLAKMQSSPGKYINPAKRDDFILKSFLVTYSQISKLCGLFSQRRISLWLSGFARYIKRIILPILFLLTVFSCPVIAQNHIRVDVKSFPEKFALLSYIPSPGDYYVSAGQLAEILDINTYQDSVLKKIVLYLDGAKVTLSADNPFIKIGEKLYQMPLPVKEYRSEIYFPVRELVAILNRHLPGDYTFDQSERTLEIYFGGMINITGLTVEEKANGTLVHIATTKYFGKDLLSWFDKDAYYLYVQFFNGKLDTVQMSSTETRGLVLRNTAVQHPEIASITFKLSRYVEDFTVTENPQTGEVLISLVVATAARPTISPPADLRDVKAEELVAKDKKEWVIDTIVIDPGHGGKDPGTIGPDGLMEKDIVLDIAKDLGNLLMNSKLVDNVVYTRDSDVFVPLQERAETANKSGGKLFISIHVNSNNNPRIRGFETYFLHPGKSEDALEVLEVVQRENYVVNLYENKDPDRELTEEDKIVLSNVQSAFVKESEQLATYISEGIDRKVNWPNMGVKQAGFFVLWRVSMPNVLVEAGFITNDNQRKELKTSAIKHRIAEGIFEGIKKFIEEVRK